VVLSNINPNKRKVILKFFSDNFSINLEQYEEDELLIVVEEVKNTINKRILEEKNKYNELSSKMQKNILDLLLMLEQNK